MNEPKIHQPQYIDSTEIVLNYYVLNDASYLAIPIRLIKWPDGYNPLASLLGENPRVELTFQVLHRGANRDRESSVYLLPMLRFVSKFPEGERNQYLYTSECFILGEHMEASFSAKEVFELILSKEVHTQSVDRGDLMHALEISYIGQAVDFLEVLLDPCFDVFGPRNCYLRLSFMTLQRTIFSATFHMEPAWIEEQQRALQEWKYEKSRELVS